VLGLTHRLNSATGGKLGGSGVQLGVGMGLDWNRTASVARRCESCPPAILQLLHNALERQGSIGVAICWQGNYLRNRNFGREVAAGPDMVSPAGIEFHRRELAQTSTGGPFQVSSRGRARASAWAASHQPSHALRPGRRRHTFSRPLHFA
jgi:hypothetical protein